MDIKLRCNGQIYADDRILGIGYARKLRRIVKMQNESYDHDPRLQSLVGKRYDGEGYIRRIIRDVQRVLSN